MLLDCQRGTAEERAAFPSRSFVYNFLRDWNKAEVRQHTDFIDHQIEAMQQFDNRRVHFDERPVPHAEAVPVLPLQSAAAPTAAPTPVPVAPRAPQPRPKPGPKSKAVPAQLAAANAAAVQVSNPAALKPATQRPPSPTPSPPHPVSTAPAVRPSAPYSARPQHPAVAKEPKRQIEVVISKRKFREIEEEGSEDGEGEGRQVVVEDAEEEEEEEDGEEEEDLYYDPPCNRCKRAGRLCEKRPNGGACVKCHKNKYKCDYSTGTVKKEKEKNEGGKGRQGGTKEREPEAKEERKGKGKKKAEPEEEGNEERKGKKKVEPEEEVNEERKEKKKAEPEAKREPKPSRTPAPKKVPTAGPSTKKAARVKSQEFIELSDEGASEQEADPKPQPKRARLRTYRDHKGEFKNNIEPFLLNGFFASYGRPNRAPGGAGGRTDAQHAAVRPSGSTARDA